MKLYVIAAGAVIAAVALCFLAQWGRHEGRVAAYEIQLAKCRQTYPRYRCEVELARVFPEMKR